MKIFLVVIFSLILCGCATVPAFDQVSLGMTKQEVINKLGSPYSVSAKDNIEYLRYQSYQGLVHNEYSKIEDYYVRLINGKVESYGKVGDFDSAKNPAIDINANVKSDGK